MDKIYHHKEIWEQKKVLRKIYKEWYEMVMNDFSSTKGPIIEIGSGTGGFKEFCTEVITSDVVEYPWLDQKINALSIPYPDNSLSNIVMVDVLHHIQDPLKFINESYRVLKKGGRLIMLEPYISPFSYLIFKLFHPEPIFLKEELFSRCFSEDIQKDPWEANQAIPTIMFYYHYKKFQGLFDAKYRIVIKKRLSYVKYPLSGGYEGKQLYPDIAYKFISILEFVLSPFSKLIAFRCYIVLEKK